MSSPAFGKVHEAVRVFAPSHLKPKRTLSVAAVLTWRGKRTMTWLYALADPPHAMLLNMVLIALAAAVWVQGWPSE